MNVSPQKKSETIRERRNSSKSGAFGTSERATSSISTNYWSNPSQSELNKIYSAQQNPEKERLSTQTDGRDHTPQKEQSEVTFHISSMRKNDEGFQSIIPSVKGIREPIVPLHSTPLQRLDFTDWIGDCAKYFGLVRHEGNG